MSEQDIQKVVDMLVERLSGKPSQQYVSKKEAAQILGISQSTIDRRIADGTLKPKKLNRRVLFDVATL